MRRVLLLALGAACGPVAGGDDLARLRATVVRLDIDTVRFAAPAVARRCADGQSLLLEGAGERGNGVLVLVRYGETLTSGAFPLLLFDDSTTPRGARVAVRFMTHDLANGFALDSGTVELTADGDSLRARLGGRGFDGARRTALDAEFTAVAFAPDTVSCRAAS